MPSTSHARPRSRQHSRARRLRTVVAVLFTASLVAAWVVVRPVSAAAATKKVTASFSIKMLTTSTSVTAGGQASYRIAVVRTGSFKRAISFDVPDLPAGAVAAVTAQSSSVYTLRIATPASAVPGSSTYVLRGRSGSIERIGIFSLTVVAPPTTTSATPTTAPPSTLAGDFALSVETASRTVNPGDVANYTINVARQNFTDPVTFSMQGAPAGARADAAPNPTVAGTTLYLTTSTSTPSGTYLIVVTGTGGGKSHSIATRLVVRRTGPFVLALSPSSSTVTAGNDAKATITVGRTSGSTVIPEVALSLVGAPTGVQIRTVSTVGAATQLVISTDASTPAGMYRMTIAGVSGTYRQGIEFVLTVVRDTPSFAISVSPSTATVVQGTVATFDVKLLKVGGFADPVAYSVSGLPPGVVPTVTASADGSATVSVPTARTTPATTYPLTITATSGGRASSVSVSLVVNAPAL